MSFLLTKSYVITENGLEWITSQQYDSLKDEIDEDEDG